ncbi:hypothetical protein P3L10_009521 [Capsicum annuum]
MHGVWLRRLLGRPSFCPLIKGKWLIGKISTQLIATSQLHGKPPAAVRRWSCLPSHTRQPPLVLILLNS